MRLILIRHAESSANAEGRLQGHLDVPLSDLGRRQSERLAEALAARLGPASAVALYTSPLRRAAETAAIVGRSAGLAPEGRDALMERDLGALSGLTPEEGRARFAEASVARREGRPFEIPGFELDEPFAQRVREGLAAIVDAHAEGAVLAVTHGGVIGSFLRQTLGIPLYRPGPFAIDNTSVTTVDVRGGGEGERRFQITGLNDACHLDGLRP